jgi:type III secretory pathway component EscV
MIVPLPTLLFDPLISVNIAAAVALHPVARRLRTLGRCEVADAGDPDRN